MTIYKNQIMEIEKQALIVAEPVKNSLTSQNHLPLNKTNHIIAAYDSKIFVIGGTLAHSGSSQQHYLNVHCFNMENALWTKKQFKHEPQSKDEQCNYQRSFMAATRIGSRLYLFGGSNNQNQCNNQLLCLDLEKLEWVNTKNWNPPDPRQSANMIKLDQNNLLLYGGVDLHLLKIFETFHIYNIKTQAWKECLGDYTKIIRPRFQSSMCLLNNKVYIFGGEYRNPDNHQFYLNDLYQVEVKSPQNKHQITARLIRPTKCPYPLPRSGHFLLPYKEEFLVVLGGENIGEESMRVAWVFSPASSAWIKIDFHNSIPKASGFYCCSSDSNEKIYVYGGINTHDSVKCDLYLMNFSPKIGQALKVKKPQCRLCMYPHKQPILTKEDVESYSQLIDFQFAAFGLLLDCCEIVHGSFFRVRYIMKSQTNEAYLEISDDNQLNYTFQQMRDSIMNYQSYMTFNPMGPIEKKVKAAIFKENYLQEYGLFLKVSALRLGDEFLYIMIRDSEVRYYSYMLEEQNESYNFFAYSWDILEEKIIKGCENDMERISNKYKHIISSILNAKTLNRIIKSNYKIRQNYLLIFGLKTYAKQNIRQGEIFPLSSVPDLINSPYKGLLSNYHPLLTESIDVSLRSYLSTFFLKNDSLNIEIWIGDKSSKIMPQMFLEGYDRMVKNKVAKQIDNSLLGIDLRILQLYYNPNLKVPTNSFQHGILIYHKGRLIQRYGCPLGHLYRKIRRGKINCFQMFGSLEVPEGVQTTLFKTGFAFNVMMEKLRSRFRYLQTHIEANMIQSKTSKQAKNSPYKIKDISPMKNQIPDKVNIFGVKYSQHKSQQQQ